MDRGVARWSVSLVAIIGIVAATLAAATIWLLVTDPVTVSTAVSTGDIEPFMRAIGDVIFDALRGLFGYL
jgi:phosphotransferase system  glucose/maltose/N-acetylglucosamine-specific IIC component